MPVGERPPKGHRGEVGQNLKPRWLSELGTDWGAWQITPGAHGTPGVSFPTTAEPSGRSNDSYPNMVRNTPAATAEPMTPATLGPMAGMRGFTLPLVSSDTNC